MIHCTQGRAGCPPSTVMSAPFLCTHKLTSIINLAPQMIRHKTARKALRHVTPVCQVVGLCYGDKAVHIDHVYQHIGKDL